jgi:tRNA dimethylallyltransferase
MSHRPPLIVLVGPTAVGKTQTAILLAERMKGEIVSADSRLFYRGMDIGTAKPTSEERARVPHHLIDVTDPDQTWSLAVFQKSARDAIADIHARGNLPFLVGGTGQYIRAVIDGWTPPTVEPNDMLRNVLRKLADQHGNTWLHEKLQILDPLAGGKIDARNVRRTIRALEVIFISGRLFSEQTKQAESLYELIQVGLIRSRIELYKQVDERIESMFELGLLDEVKGLLEKGYSPDLPSMSAIGYRECVKVLMRLITEDQAKIEMRKSTRVFIRRQANWFKPNDPDIYWMDAGATSLDEIEDYISRNLESRNKLSR